MTFIFEFCELNPEFITWMSSLSIKRHTQIYNIPFQLNACYCMNCLDGIKQMADETLDLVFADPPFSIKNGATHTKDYNRNGDLVIEGYKEVPLEEYESFSNNWISAIYPKLKKTGLIIIVSSWSNQRYILNALEHANLHLISQVVWKYNFGLFTTRKLVSSHYNIFICSKAKNPNKTTFNKLFWYCEDTFESSEDLIAYEQEQRDRDLQIQVWKIPREYWRGEEKTPNKLPTELVELLIMQYSKPNDLILDPFSGSGTTLKVATDLGRACICFEIVSKYADFSNRRYLNQIH